MFIKQPWFLFFLLFSRILGRNYVKAFRPVCQQNSSSAQEDHIWYGGEASKDVCKWAESAQVLQRKICGKKQLARSLDCWQLFQFWALSTSYHMTEKQRVFTQTQQQDTSCSQMILNYTNQSAITTNSKGFGKNIQLCCLFSLPYLGMDTPYFVQDLQQVVL